MPAFDGTGPRGMGPMTGGGRGWCNPYYRRMSTQSMGFFAPNLRTGCDPPTKWLPGSLTFKGSGLFPAAFWAPAGA